jgi:hypothetical protein
MKRRCLLVLIPAVALVLACVPAEAKGRDPVKAVIRGPGLVEPIVIRGNMGMPLGDRYWAFALSMFGSSSDPSSDSPLSTGDLGPRYFVDYLELCCRHRVRQYLYPYATGGPVTYTPAGQRSDMFQMYMTDYIGSSQTGWHRVATTLGATSSFVGWHRVAATMRQLSFAQSAVNPRRRSRRFQTVAAHLACDRNQHPPCAHGIDSDSAPFVTNVGTMAGHGPAT